MITIREVGIIDIDREDIGSIKLKWARLKIHDNDLIIHFTKKPVDEHAVRVRYYKSGAQIIADEFLWSNRIAGEFYSTRKKATLKVGLDEEGYCYAD